MAKSKLDRFPPEVRQRLQPNGLTPAEFGQKLAAAFRALASHYGLDPGPQPSGSTFWPDLALALAADFLPALRWFKAPAAPKPGRPRMPDADALARLYEARQELRQHRDQHACELIADRWANAPSENPFGRELSAVTLRKYLPGAKAEGWRRLISGEITDISGIGLLGWGAKTPKRAKK